jgi:hypothetical protein
MSLIRIKGYTHSTHCRAWRGIIGSIKITHVIVLADVLQVLWPWPLCGDVLDEWNNILHIANRLAITTNIHRWGELIRLKHGKLSERVMIEYANQVNLWG